MEDDDYVIPKRRKIQQQVPPMRHLLPARSQHEVDSLMRMQSPFANDPRSQKLLKICGLHPVMTPTDDRIEEYEKAIDLIRQKKKLDGNDLIRIEELSEKIEEEKRKMKIRLKKSMQEKRSFDKWQDIYTKREEKRKLDKLTREEEQLYLNEDIGIWEDKTRIGRKDNVIPRRRKPDMRTVVRDNKPSRVLSSRADAFKFLDLEAESDAEWQPEEGLFEVE